MRRAGVEVAFEKIGVLGAIVRRYRDFPAAVRGHLLERAGDRDRAMASYRRAAQATTSVAERDYLLVRAARLDGG